MEKIRRVYFEYWLLQNNIEYIQFYKGVLDKEGASEPLQWFKKDLRKFGLVSLVNPFRKIDWDYFREMKKPDKLLLLSMNLARDDAFYAPVWLTPDLESYSRKEYEEYKRYEQEILLERISNPLTPFCPFVNVTIDLRFDKKEIIEGLHKIIDYHRKIWEIEPYNRDFINKFHLYAQTWDLRKGSERITFRDIARVMRTNFSTVKSRFYKAFELIYNKPYDPNLFIKAKKTVHKESLQRLCNDCNERETCTTPCPDIIQFIEQDQVKLRERTTSHIDAFPDKSGTDHSGDDD
jgi:hypothetical protein